MDSRWVTRTGWLRSMVWTACGLALVGTAPGASDKPQRPHPRSRPPGAQWDPASAEIFSADAFGLLMGPRPDFAGVTAGSAPAGSAEPGVPPKADGDGFKWSLLVTGDTLTDEIKDMKDVLAAATANASTFKGGGYDDARRAFSTLALAFGIVAAHDEDIRWQRDAATARKLFGRAGFNCKVGTDKSFAESKLCLEDLQGMLDGNPPRRKPEDEEDFRWSNVAARPAIMSLLEGAEKILAAGVASAGEFGKQRDAILHEAELVAALGEVIQQPDFEYHDDDIYRQYASAMRDAAVGIRDACRDKNYDAARTATGRMSKACGDCHGEYR
mgnify:FL=1